MSSGRIVGSAMVLLGVILMGNPAMGAASGHVVAWGKNSSGETNIPPTMTNVVAVTAGDGFSVALQADGQVAVWGNNTYGQTNIPANLYSLTVTAIAAGGNHILALRSNQKVTGWGDNSSGQISQPYDLTNVVAIAAGSKHSVALRGNGTVAAWGNNSAGQTNISPNLTNVVAIAAGAKHNVALRTDGHVAAWGDNSSGQTNVPASLSNVVAVAAGGNVSMALRANGIVTVWGSNSGGQTNVPAGLTNLIAIGAGNDHCLALRSDGKTFVWGKNTYGQTNLPSDVTNVSALAAGRYHSLAVLPTGVVTFTVSSAYATPLPSVGPHLLSMTSVQTSRVAAVVQNGGTQYVNTGWIGTGSVPATGTTNRNICVVTSDSSIAWQWTTNYSLAVMTTNGGAVSTTGGTYLTEANVQVSAATNVGYDFAGWFGDTNGCVLAGTNITVAMTGARVIEARFTAVTGSPVIALSSAGLSFTGQVYGFVQGQTLTVSNAGTGLLDYRINVDAIWMSAQSPSGLLLPGQTKTHVVRASSVGLAARNYHGTLSVVAAGSVNTPQTVPVGVTLSPANPPTRVTAWGNSGNGQVTVPASATNATELAGGTAFALARRSTGSLLAWGKNSKGQSTVPPGVATALSVACGAEHALAVLADGTVVAWGNNGNGQTNVPVGLTTVVAVAAGKSHSLALRSNGTVVAWGSNGKGEATVPAGLTNVIGIAAGKSHSVAVCMDGHVVAWGSNGNGQTNVPASLTNAVAVYAGDAFSAALRANGSVAVWGSNNKGQATLPSGLTNVLALALGSEHCVAMYGSGQMVSWGSNSKAQTTVPADLTNVIGLAAGKDFSLALSTTQSISTAFSTTIRVAPASLIFTGQVFSTVVGQALTISNAGNDVLSYTVGADVPWASADTLSGTLGFGQETSIVVNAMVIPLAAGTYQGNVIVRNSGNTTDVQTVAVTLTVYAIPPPSRVISWGDNSYGQTNVPANMTNVVAMAGGLYHTVALRGTGRVSCWGNSNYFQTTTPVALLLTNSMAVGAGRYHSLAVMTNGQVVAWGYNGSGQATVPASLSNVTAVAGGWNHSAALLSSGRVVVWGQSSFGQTNVPANVTDAVAIASGSYHLLALRSNGTVVAWGYDGDGQTNVPAGLNHVVAIACGSSHSLALKSDGRVVAWGNNDKGQTNVVAGLTNAVGIAAGVHFSMALRADGTVVAWGDNGATETNVPVTLTNVTSIACGGAHALAICPAQVLVVSSPYGTPYPPVGTNWLTLGSHIAATNTLSIEDGGTQYVNVGWIGSGSVPAFGTSNTVGFKLPNPSTLDWVWNTNFWLNIDVGGVGHVSPTNGWHAMGSDVLLTATTDPGFALVGWFGNTNGCTINGDEITVPMTEARSISALFSGPAIAAEPPTVTLTGQVFQVVEGQNLTVSNAGIGQLNFTITPDVFWLSVDHPQGSLGAGQATTVVVQANSLGLDAHPYRGNLLISDPIATNTPMSVSVVAALGPVPPPCFVVGWGENSNGQTDVPPTLTNVIGMTAGSYHSVALQADGTVVAWGDNLHGQTNVPVQLTNAIAISGGAFHTLALRSDGTVVAWGYDTDEQTNVPPSLANVVAVSAGYFHSLALDTAGSITAWGQDTYGQRSVPSSLTNMVAVAGGGLHTLALRRNGTVVAWGYGGDGETNVPLGLTNVVAISAGGTHNLALQSNGRVVAWGDNSVGQTNVPASLSNVVAISAGLTHSMALTTDGVVVVWGDNSSGQADVPTDLTNVIAVGGGALHSLALVSTTPPGGGGGSVSFVEFSGDGSPLSVPQKWLDAHGVSAADLDADQDQDGLSALAEYIAGSDPQDAASVFSIDEAVSASGETFVSFQSETGRVYTLEIRSGVQSGTWSAVSGQIDVPGTGATMTLSDSVPPSTPHYYRVRVALP